jgi:hypothetical protein
MPPRTSQRSERSVARLRQGHGSSASCRVRNSLGGKRRNNAVTRSARTRKWSRSETALLPLAKNNVRAFAFRLRGPRARVYTLDAPLNGKVLYATGGCRVHSCGVARVALVATSLGASGVSIARALSLPETECLRISTLRIIPTPNTQKSMEMVREVDQRPDTGDLRARMPSCALLQHSDESDTWFSFIPS